MLDSLKQKKNSKRIKMRIKTGDLVKVINGKEKGKTGEVLKTIPLENRVVVKGINLRTKHVKPTLNTRSLTNFKVPFVSIIRTEKKPDIKKNRGIRQLLIYLPIILIHSSAGAIFSIQNIFAKSGWKMMSMLIRTDFNNKNKG